MRRTILLLLASACTLATASAAPVQQGPANRPDQVPAFAGQTRADEVRSGVAFKVETIASGLEYPWGLDFLPDGRAIVTEKPGRMRIIAANGTLLPPIVGVPKVSYQGQGGLLDVLVIPGSNPLRICYTYASVRGTNGDTGTTARCATGNPAAGNNLKLSYGRTVWQQNPSYGGSHNHFGGRIVLAPDGKLFITNGERSDVPIRERAQDLAYGMGKIVRVNQDGSAPTDNPFYRGSNSLTSKIWSYGHRNPQGAAINPTTGQLWTIEHGPRGGDELNAPKAGKNYGWPVITYGEDYNGSPINGDITQQAGMEQPVYYWDPVIAPSGIAWYTGDLFPRWQGNLFISDLGQQSITRLEISGERVTGEERFAMGHRIRDVAQAPDGSIWALTDEANGLVLRISPQ